MNRLKTKKIPIIIHSGYSSQSREKVNQWVSNYRKFSVIWNTLKVSIFSGSGWPLFNENTGTLMLYQQDIQLGLYFVKWQLVLE